MIGVYTAIFGKYDILQPTPYNGVIFTDQVNIPENLGWHIELVKPPHEKSNYASRYYFDQSCLAMPECEYTVMHGGNATLKVHPAELVEMLPPGIDLAACRHHHRSTVWEEAEAVLRMHKDTPDLVNAQMERYKSEGFPGDNLSACIILVRRNTPRLKEFETFWWNEVKNNSVRDQLSFDYSLWRLDMPIFYLPDTWLKYLTLNKHRNGKNYNHLKNH